MDDILCLWPNYLNLNTFLPRLNSLVPSINFTVEKEVDFKLPFLDVLIHRVCGMQRVCNLYSANAHTLIERLSPPTSEPGC